MSRDEQSKNLRLYDRRILERNMRKGLVSPKDYEKWLKALPDVADKLAPKDEPTSSVDLDDDEDDLDDDDGDDSQSAA